MTEKYFLQRLDRAANERDWFQPPLIHLTLPLFKGRQK